MWVNRVAVFPVHIQACYSRSSEALAPYFVENIDSGPERGRRIHSSFCQFCDNSIGGDTCRTDGYVLVPKSGNILNGLNCFRDSFSFGQKCWFDHQVDLGGVAVLPQAMRCSLELVLRTSCIDADVSDEVIARLQPHAN